MRLNCVNSYDEGRSLYLRSTVHVATGVFQTNAGTPSKKRLIGPCGRYAQLSLNEAGVDGPSGSRRVDCSTLTFRVRVSPSKALDRDCFSGWWVALSLLCGRTKITGEMKKYEDEGGE